MIVYKAINAVQAELASIGITKSRRNPQGNGYNFRGIDDVYNTISPLLAKHGLCILPRVLSRQCVERKSNNGGNLFFITVEMEFDLVSSEDGSKHTIKTFGEAMDSGDKATNKAMSAAYKYAAFQAFAIPTEGDNDTENHTHEVLPSEDQAFEDEHLDNLRGAAMEGLSVLEAEFKKIPVSAAKARFWTRNQKSLKDAAMKGAAK